MLRSLKTFKNLCSQNTPPVKETAKGVLCVAGKKGGGRKMDDVRARWNLGLSGAHG